MRQFTVLLLLTFVATGITACGEASFRGEIATESHKVRSEPKNMDATATGNAVTPALPESVDSSGDLEVEAVKDETLESEEVVANKPVVISGAYLFLHCEQLSQLPEDVSLRAIGCRVMSSDGRQVPLSERKISLGIKNKDGEVIPVVRPDHFDNRKWDDVFFVKKSDIKDMVIQNENHSLDMKPFSFDIKKIKSFVRKIEQSRLVDETEQN